MAFLDVFISFGQSNELCSETPSVPARIPFAGVPYWLRVVGDAATNDNAFRALGVRASNGTHGAELQQGLDLYDAGLNPVHIKVCRGNTFLSEWIPGTGNGNALLSEITDARTALLAAYPAHTIRWHLICKQGESEAKDATDAAALAWGSNFDLIEAAIVAITGPLYLGGPLILLTHASTGSAPHLATVRAQQTSRAWRTLSGDDLPLLGDATHYAAANQNVLGSRIAAIYLEELTTMGTLSSYARTSLVDHFRNKAAYTPAATHYAAAFVGGVEVSGNAYARVGLTNNTTTWPNAASRAKSNGVAFTFPNATGAWGAIDEIRIFDHVSAGNELARHTLASPVTISGSTGPLTIPIGDIDITAAAGCFTDTVVHELLNLMFGATANSPRATVHGTYFAGDPQGAGAETSAARTSITQATAWGAASAGLAISAAAVALADEADATHYAEYTAGSGGTLLFSAQLPVSFTPPVGGIIPAGGLRTNVT